MKSKSKLFITSLLIAVIAMLMVIFTIIVKTTIEDALTQVSMNTYQMERELS